MRDHDLMECSRTMYRLYARRSTRSRPIAEVVSTVILYLLYAGGLLILANYYR